MQMKAVSTEEPSRLVQSLTGAILGCGGWVLSRGANDTGAVSMLFEFERQACVDIYSILIAAGVELSQNGHIRFTELCQCTRSHQRDCGAEIASIDLEIQTFPVEDGLSAPGACGSRELATADGRKADRGKFSASVDPRPAHTAVAISL